MHWRIKAMIQSACAAVPGGGALYHQFQTRCGNLRQVDLGRKLSYQRNLVQLLRRHDAPVEGAEFFEVGTGWIPLMPLGFWICGAARFVTVDLNRYLSLGLTRRSLHWMKDHRAELLEMWSQVARREVVEPRLDRAIALRDRPADLLREAGIDYRAPADASATGLPAASFDVHFSYNVFEHVPPAGIQGILAEARRILKPDGLTFHYVDPSDHFEHADKRLTKIDFLRYEPAQWERLAGNAYAYTNRLRDSDFRAMIAERGFALTEVRFDVDARSLEALRAGFPLGSPFRGRDPEDLCRHNLVYVAVHSERAAAARERSPEAMKSG